jgi:predicted nuclease of restriction endonuclease-like (RecB) superfamily
MSKKDRFESLLGLFEQTHTGLQREAARAVNHALTVRNWLFGWYIVEFEQGGADRAELYGKKLIKRLADELSVRMDKGISQRYLEQCRQFFDSNQKIAKTLSAQSLDHHASCLPANSYGKLDAIFQSSGLIKNPAENLRKIWQTLSAEFPLSWSHYVFLMGINNPPERAFYEKEAAGADWSLRELKRQFDSGLYERLALSRDKEGIRQLAEKGQTVEQPHDLIKSPYVLEFLGLDEQAKYSESDLESAIIDKLEHFLLELGKGFLFEARQKRFTLDEDHYYVDLVFYNRLLRCYTLIDLKIGELTHQDLGQMQMYVNWFDRHVKLEQENPTIGIVICKKKKEALVEITLPKDANIHASEYLLYLPSKEELKRQVEESLREEGITE